MLILGKKKKSNGLVNMSFVNDKNRKKQALENL